MADRKHGVEPPPTESEVRQADWYGVDVSGQEYARVAFSFGIGAPSGMNTVALMPSSCAASATPCAWLPADAATTPCERSSSESRESRR